MSKFNPHFLVISLGNPGNYYETLHSTGHFALQALQKAITTQVGPQPPFTLDKRHSKVCLGSKGTKYTLLQSPSFMNVSGRFVANSWNKTIKQYQRGIESVSEEDAEPGSRLDHCLVIVHDELEAEFGAVKTRKWIASHRGHNGLKSVGNLLKLRKNPSARWARIAVGIDRPFSRNSDEVAKYVLSPLSQEQKEIIDTEVGSKVLACLDELEEEWRWEHDRMVALKNKMAARVPAPDE